MAADKKALDLSHFRGGKWVAAKSHMWAPIAAWQRAGLVRLKWADDKSGCTVTLTDKGMDEARRAQANG